MVCRACVAPAHAAARCAGMPALLAQRVHAFKLAHCSGIQHQPGCVAQTHCSISPGSSAVRQRCPVPANTSSGRLPYRACEAAVCLAEQPLHRPPQPQATSLRCRCAMSPFMAAFLAAGQSGSCWHSAQLHGRSGASFASPPVHPTRHAVAEQVHYTGRLESGEVFDSSREREPLSFQVASAHHYWRCIALLRLPRHSGLTLCTGKCTNGQVMCRQPLGPPCGSSVRGSRWVAAGWLQGLMLQSTGWRWAARVHSGCRPSRPMVCFWSCTSASMEHQQPCAPFHIWHFTAHV